MRYDVDVMTSSREKVKSNGPRARVCVCGYDLTGLGDEAEARCPECGAAVADQIRIGPLRRWERPFFWASLVPGFLAVPVVVVMAVLAVVAAPPTARNTAAWIMLVFMVGFWGSFFVVGVPASAGWGIARYWSKQAGERGPYIGAAMGLMLLLNLAGMGLAWAGFMVLFA